MAKGERTYQFKALTDLWTGNANGESDRLISTGLLGSIRWWFEVLVRGLGGNACDPTNTKCEGWNHCAVCELFGCTGWARKFRFEVLDENSGTKTDQITKDQTFFLQFTPLRPIRDEEWALLDATLRLIADYGAIGGKTVFKPADERSRANKLHHKDFGLIQVLSSLPPARICRDDLKKYLSQWRKLNHGEFAWASLEHFWFVKEKYLTRESNSKSTFNKALGRQETKNKGQELVNRNDGTAKWLAGSQQESKKVFSFKNPARTFGFVKPGLVSFNAMKGRLTKAWEENDWKLFSGDEIMKLLFNEEDRS